MSTFRKARKAVKYQLIYWLVRSLIFVSVIPPRKRWLSFCGWLGVVFYTFSRQTRALVQRHLSMAFPEKSAHEIRVLSKDVFRMLGKNAGDILRSSTIRTIQDLEKI